MEMLQNFGTLWTQAAWYSHLNWLFVHPGCFVCFVFVFYKEYSPALPSFEVDVKPVSLANCTAWTLKCELSADLVACQTCGHPCFNTKAANFWSCPLAPKGGCPQSIHFKNSFKLHLVKNRFDLDLVLPCVGRASQEGVLIHSMWAAGGCDMQELPGSRSRRGTGSPCHQFCFSGGFCTSDGSFDL